MCERAFVAELNGGCSSPVAAHARIHGDRIKLIGLYYNEADQGWLQGQRRGLWKMRRNWAAGWPGS